MCRLWARELFPWDAVPARYEAAGSRGALAHAAPAAFALLHLQSRAFAMELDVRARVACRAAAHAPCAATRTAACADVLLGLLCLRPALLLRAVLAASNALRSPLTPIVAHAVFGWAAACTAECPRALLTARTCRQPCTCLWSLRARGSVRRARLRTSSFTDRRTHALTPRR
jgi:hypothetical protein